MSYWRPSAKTCTNRKKSGYDKHPQLCLKELGDIGTVTLTMENCESLVKEAVVMPVELQNDLSMLCI